MKVTNRYSYSSSFGHLFGYPAMIFVDRQALSLLLQAFFFEVEAGRVD
jgi:hypothetical protein